MTFEFKNLGAIKEAQIEMGRLTVISGKNNTGKTYLTYAVWGLSAGGFYTINASDTFKSISDSEKLLLASELDSGILKEVDLSPLENEFTSRYLSSVLRYEEQINLLFGTSNTFFKNTKITCAYNDIKEEISRRIYGERDDNNAYIFKYENIEGTLIFKLQIQKMKDKTFDVYELEKCLGSIGYHVFYHNPYLFTAQREAIHLFKYSINKSARYGLRNGIKNNQRDKYAIPLERNIDFVSDFDNLEQNYSFLKDTDLITEIEQILGIKYQIHYDSFQVENANGITTPAFMASTSVRTLADLHFYHKHLAQKGDLLMIDEPELNLHPENQIKIARLLVKLVNAGIRVWITTHSDYIVKELNNCLMLSNDFTDKEAFMQEYNYKENDILKKEDIRVYIAHEEGTVEQVEIGKFGMKKTTFDEALKRFNEVSDTLFNILD